MKKEFKEFLESDLELLLWENGKIIFSSKDPGLRGLMDFLHKNSEQKKEIVAFDKVIGRAAAMLMSLANVKEAYGEIGSKLAEDFLKENNINYYFQETLPNILNREKTGLCPMEQLSLGKSPKNFYEALLSKR